MGFQQSGPGLESFWPTASPLCVPGTKVSPRVSVKYIMLIFICCYQLMVWSRLWKSWAPPQENDSAPTLAFSVPPLSGLSWQHWRHWGTVLCTHNPTSLKLMQSPLKSHLCSFSTGKDQRLTCAQRLSAALDQVFCHCPCSCRHRESHMGPSMWTCSILFLG